MSAGGRRQRALRLQAAVAAVPAEDEDALWPDEVRSLNAAASVARRITR